jgi:hypothetical protein
MLVIDEDPAVVDLQSRRATAVRRLADLFERFTECEAEADRRLEALCAADYRLDLCVGSIAARLGVDETARRTSWSHGRVEVALAAYITARTEVEALHPLEDEPGVGRGGG